MRSTAGSGRRAEMARDDPGRAARGVVRYTQRWLDDPTTFLGGGTSDDRALLAEPDAGAMLAADVTEALRPGAGGMADDLVALWMQWGFRIADVLPGVRISHGAQDTRGEPDFRYLAATLPACRAEVWPDAGHLGVVRHWRRSSSPSLHPEHNTLRLSANLGNVRRDQAVARSGSGARAPGWRR